MSEHPRLALLAREEIQLNLILSLFLSLIAKFRHSHDSLGNSYYDGISLAMAAFPFGT